MGRREHIARLNADAAFRERVRRAASEGMRRWWADRKLPAEVARHRWKYRLLRERVGREEALRILLSSPTGPAPQPRG